MAPQHWIVVGALFGALAVGTGAFGAHGLKKRLEESQQTANYETAARYQMYHAVALVLVGIVGTAATTNSLALNIAGGCFTAGILIFSGLLYAIALGGPSKLGMIVPIGGTAFIVGWVALAVAALSAIKK